MGIITPTNKSVTSLTGLHLYHTGFSNCAMRVRIALEEKKLQWKSHLVDILKGENLTKEYMGINPNAVVPPLVDNGVVIIDSADIIDYLDKTFSPGSLRPVTKKDEDEMYYWMYLARDNHLFIKTYMYGHVDFLDKMKKTPEQMEAYRKNQTFDEALLHFHERFNSSTGFLQEELEQATSVLDDMFSQMNQRLKGHHWLAGDRFTLADIAWIPQLVILKVAKYPLQNYPHLEQWKNYITKRQSFKKGVLDWLPDMGK